jgi:hypothetical protein
MTKTKTISKTILNRIFKNNSIRNSFWKDIFEVGEYCYFTNGYQMFRCPRSVLDVSGTDIRVMDIRNYNDREKQSIETMVKIFNKALDSVSGLKSDCCYRINKTLLKSTIMEVKKKFKNVDHLGMVGKVAPISVWFEKTIVDAKYLSELIQINGEKIVDVYVDNSKPLIPIVIGNMTDDVVSILCPLRDGYEPKKIDVTAVLSA